MPRLALAAALGWALAGPALAQGLFDDTEARRRIDSLRQQVEASQKAIEARLSRIEADAVERRAILDLAGQIEALRAEIARMRGQVELLAHQAETAEKRQKDLYLDIDTRLRKLEQAREQAPGPDKPAAGDAAAAPAETKAYEAALNQFKLGNYALSISAFQGLLVTYPSSKLAPNAHYWMGIAYAAQGQHKPAIATQQKLLASWPDDAKSPDAMLAIAVSQEALGDRRGAQKTLEGLVTKYPASPAAASARQRLKK